jgi:hypothetical protein
MENGLLIYYSHPISTYFTEIEQQDIDYLFQFQPYARIINPNEIGASRMSAYLRVVSDCDIVCYHGETWEVVFEVVTSLTLGKPVFNITQQRNIISEEIQHFIEIFTSSKHRKQDIALVKSLFPGLYENFLDKLRGWKNEN